MRHYSKLDSKPTVFTIQAYAHTYMHVQQDISGTQSNGISLEKQRGVVAFPCDFLIDVPPWNWPSMGNRGYRQPAKVFLLPSPNTFRAYYIFITAAEKLNCSKKKVTGQLGQ